MQTPAVVVLGLMLGMLPPAAERPPVRVAVLPALTRLSLRPSGRLPDMRWVDAREAAAAEAASMVVGHVALGAVEWVAEDEVSAALSTLRMAPADLLASTRPAAWDAPAQVLRGRKGETVALLATRDQLRASGASAPYRHSVRGAPAAYGLASFGAADEARPDPERARTLARALRADALLVLIVGERERSDQFYNAPEAYEQFDHLRTEHIPVQTTEGLGVFPAAGEIVAGYEWRHTALPIDALLIAGQTGVVGRTARSVGHYQQMVTVRWNGRVEGVCTPHSQAARAVADGIGPLLILLFAPVFVPAPGARP